MMIKLLALLPPLAGIALFLTGALDRPVPEAAQPAAPAFAPQPLPLVQGGGDPARLLDSALDRLSPARLSWLRVRLWQQMTDSEVRFESEGTLQIGPRHCARLDLRVLAGPRASRLLVVSDGHALAHVLQPDGEAPVVTSQLLAPPPPAVPTKSPTELLRAKGCGGPHPLLKELRAKLRDLTAQTGLWQNRPTVRLKGLLAERLQGEAATAVVADFCYVYLDAQSLWPHRVEWWGTDKKQNLRPLLQLEFRDAELNRELSLPECVREFSYQPPAGG